MYKAKALNLNIETPTTEKKSEIFFKSNPSPIVSLSWILLNFIKIDTWICPSCYMGLWKLLLGYVKVVLCISRFSLTKISKLVEAFDLIWWENRGTLMGWCLEFTAHPFLLCSRPLCHWFNFAHFGLTFFRFLVHLLGFCIVVAHKFLIKSSFAWGTGAQTISKEYKANNKRKQERKFWTHEGIIYIISNFI